MPTVLKPILTAYCTPRWPRPPKPSTATTSPYSAWAVSAISACNTPSRWVSKRWASRAARTRHRSPGSWASGALRSEEHTSELQSHSDLVCRLLLEKKKKKKKQEKHAIEQKNSK